MLTASCRRLDGASGRAFGAGEIDELITLDAETERRLGETPERRWSRFLDAWKTIAREKRGLPARTDIDPLRLGADLLPNVFLADVVREHGKAAPRFRFRLLGQAILDRETTRAGQFLDELGASADIGEIDRHYRACLERKVALREASLVWNDVRKDAFTYSVLVLPLSDDGESVTHLLGLALYHF